MSDVKLPRYDKRTTVIGSTGTGKTQFAVWLLSSRDYNIRPWIIFDFKGDELIEDIGAKEINVRGKVPKEPGLYVVRPIPELDDGYVLNFLWQIWAQGNTGVYIDEGYMVGNRNPALNACLTQGRSKHVEMIILSQRPVWMSKFVFSEANYFAVFNLTVEDDRKHISGFIPKTRIDLLPKYHCLWYDVDRQKADIFSPVPEREQLIKTFRERLEKKSRKI